MSKTPDDESRTLDAALDELVYSFDGAPNAAQLLAWLRERPLYAPYRDEIAGYAARWSLRAVLQPGPASPIPAYDPALVARAVAAAAQVRIETAPRHAPLRTITEWLREMGRPPAEAARQAGVSVSLFAQLDRRLIDAETIPPTVVARLAAAIERSVADVREYLVGGAMLPAAAQYRAAAPPTARTHSFADAVRDDPMLSAAERGALVALIAADQTDADGAG